MSFLRYNARGTKSNKAVGNIDSEALKSRVDAIIWVYCLVTIEVVIEIGKSNIKSIGRITNENLNFC